MNLVCMSYLDNAFEGFVSRNFGHNLLNAEFVLQDAEDFLYKHRREIDQIYFLTAILKANENSIVKHRIKCLHPRNVCQQEKAAEKINYFLQQELEERDITLPNDQFTSE